MFSGSYISASTNDISPGEYSLVCDTIGFLSYMEFEYNGRSHKEYFAPYRLQNIELNCGETAQVSITGSTWSQQCFSRDFALTTSACAAPACPGNYVCPLHAEPIPGRSCIEKFDDCQCQSGYEKNFFTGACAEICRNDYTCPANSQRRLDRGCYESFDGM